MRDVFYTIVVIWIVMQIYNSFRSVGNRPANQQQPQQRRQGDVTVETNNKNNNRNDDKGGEYVDYEEIKD